MDNLSDFFNKFEQSKKQLEKDAGPLVDKINKIILSVPKKYRPIPSTKQSIAVPESQMRQIIQRVSQFLDRNEKSPYIYNKSDSYFYMQKHHEVHIDFQGKPKLHKAKILFEILYDYLETYGVLVKNWNVVTIDKSTLVKVIRAKNIKDDDLDLWIRIAKGTLMRKIKKFGNYISISNYSKLTKGYEIKIKVD